MQASPLTSSARTDLASQPHAQKQWIAESMTWSLSKTSKRATWPSKHDSGSSATKYFVRGTRRVSATGTAQTTETERKAKREQWGFLSGAAMALGASLPFAAERPVNAVEGRVAGARVPSTAPAAGHWDGSGPAVLRMRLEDFAALGSTGSRIACFSKALTLAGILTFAVVARALAGALALTSIGATTMDCLGMGSCGERAGGEDRGGRSEER